jgi:hypothetical protein
VTARFGAPFAVLVALACSGSAPPPVESGDASLAWTECTDPRPQVCTRDYRPVCAVRDNGVRCVTTPCDSSEEHSYSNGCTACSDAAVYRHRPGACEQAPGRS